MKSDVYARVTARIVADLEAGERTWLKPWNAEHSAGKISRPLRSCGVPYQGVNILVLWAEAFLKGYSAPIWMTYKQAAELGGHVRKGETGSMVVYSSSVTRTEKDEQGEDVEKQIPFLKAYTVFNVEQVDELPAHFYSKAAPQIDPAQKIERAERFFVNLRADLRHGGNRAYYNPNADYIQMPPFESFQSG